MCLFECVKIFAFQAIILIRYCMWVGIVFDGVCNLKVWVDAFKPTARSTVCLVNF